MSTTLTPASPTLQYAEHSLVVRRLLKQEMIDVHPHHGEHTDFIDRQRDARRQYGLRTPAGKQVHLHMPTRRRVALQNYRKQRRSAFVARRYNDIMTRTIGLK